MSTASATPPRDENLEHDCLARFAFIDSAAQPRVLSSTYDAKAFGNAVVELAGDHLRIRVVRDRSQLLVDLSPPHRFDWFDLHIVLHFVGADDEAETLAHGEWRELAASADAIDRHFARIVAAFHPSNWPHAQDVLRLLQERRAKQLFGGQSSSQAGDCI